MIVPQFLCILGIRWLCLIYFAKIKYLFPSYRTMSFRGTSLVTTTTNGTPVKAAGGKGFDVNDMGTKQAKVILDYDAIMNTELSVKQNDVSVPR